MSGLLWNELLQYTIKNLNDIPPKTGVFREETINKTVSVLLFSTI